jgi:hypothetical protein
MLRIASPAQMDSSSFDWLTAEVPGLLNTRVLSVALWKWFALLTLVVVACAASWMAAGLIVRLLHPVARRSRTAIDERLLEVAVGPLRLGLALAVFVAGTLVLPLAPPVRALLLALERTAAALTVTWLLLRTIDTLADVARTRLAAGGRDGAAALVPVGGKAARVVVVALALSRSSCSSRSTRCCTRTRGSIPRRLASASSASARTRSTWRSSPTC